MKKKLSLLLLILLFPIEVYAAGNASISGTSQVELGSTVTVSVTLKNTAAWNIRINSSGSTSGCSQSFADATTNGKNATKTLSVTCKATSLGTIGFTATGDITSADGSTTNVSLSKRVTVVPVREKSTDATLSSLTLEGYELTPTFNKEVLEYTVTVPSTINKVKVDAKVNESHANLTGTGEFEVTEGMNTFEVVVTAENGATKTYKVVVNVEDTNPIHVQIGNKEYVLIKNAKSLIKPELYDETTITINNMEIPAFESEITKFTLVGIKDETGKIFLAIYNEETNEYKIYNESKANAINLYLVDFPNEIKDYLKTKITINEIEVPAYKKEENNRYAIVYGMNVETGEYGYYKFDTQENTFQIWDQEELENLKKDIETYKLACFVFGGGLGLAFLLIICILCSKSKKKRKKKEIPIEIVTEKKKESIEKDEEVKVEEKPDEKKEDIYNMFEEIKNKK